MQITIPLMLMDAFGCYGMLLELILNLFALLLTIYMGVYIYYMELFWSWFTIIYVFNQLELRRHLWRYLATLAAGIQDVWCISGDFNNVLYVNDRLVVMGLMQLCLVI